jgi:hypothetical protein
MTGAAAKPYENKVGLSAEKVAHLEALLKRLENHEADLHHQALRYLLDDGPEAVLDAVAAYPESGQALQLFSAWRKVRPLGITGWDEFLATIEPVEPTFYLRVGKLLAAAATKIRANPFFCQASFDGNRWLEMLLLEASLITADARHSDERKKLALSGPLIDSMLSADGREIKPFLSTPFLKTDDYHLARRRELVMAVADMKTLFVKYRDFIAGFLRNGNAEARLIAMENLALAETPIESFAEELVAAAFDSSRQVREAAESMLRMGAMSAQQVLMRYAADGRRSERESAVRLLGRLLRAQAEAFLRARLDVETSEPVREAIVAALGDAAAAAQPFDLTTPERPPVDLSPPFTPALREAVKLLVFEFNAAAEKHNQELAASGPQQYVYPRHPIEMLTAEQFEELCRRLEHGGKLIGFGVGTAVQHAQGGFQFDGEPTGAYRALLEHPDLKLVHLVRLFGLLRLIQNRHTELELQWSAFGQLDFYRRTHEPPCTLSDVDDVFRALGHDERLLVDSILNKSWDVLEWEPAALWPFYLRHVQELVKSVDLTAATEWTSKYHQEQRRETVFRLLKTFPQVPPVLVGKLWEMAIGTHKADRARAQAIVVKLPDLDERLVQALSSGNYSTRSAAAEWLGRIGDRRAIGPLRAAAKKEKQDAALDELLTALEKLGEPIEEFLDRERLVADAAKNLKKGLPAALDWFPWDRLPALRWHDTGKSVPPDLVRWLIVWSYKSKSAEAGPLLRRYAQLMRPDERSALSTFVLAAWFDRDLMRKYSDAEARAEAKRRVAMWGGGNSPAQQQEWENRIFEQLQRECASAVAEKGILAVAGACGDESIVAPVAKYLKEWYGYRAAQCKALIAMLSAVDRPTALQYLLSISNRFRTKGIRDEAERYVQLLADRKGWTLDELADRTMPTAGFDDDGTLVLDFGPRKFTARVNDQMEITLADEDDKSLKALPAPRKDDDESLAATAKKAYSAAKSELKKFASAQATRLYEAMCTERVWPAADWRMFFLGHPLMRILCRRVVWAVFDASDALVGTFRPLEDGTFTTFDDETYDLPDNARIRIAHGCRLPADAAAAWTRHLADYEVASLFPQFGRESHALSEEKKKAKSVDEFKGYVVEAFKLRGLATKFGYTRGETGDGGWFYDYVKTYPGLGLAVNLGFSGNGLPEENRTVALTELSFRKTAAQEGRFGSRQSLSLADVPSVLLSECYNDLRTIAASGSGFDADWEKKVR